ncbi:MAG: PIN domain-containing protein [Solirubrobacteraceae bacterium]
MAKRATAILAANGQLLLADLVLAECVYVLESFYEVDRVRVAELMRAAIALPSVAVLDARLLLRSLEIYEIDRLDFAEAYLVACAEATGVGAVPVLRPRDRPRRDRRAHRALTRDPSVTRRLTGQRYPLGSI